MTDKEICEYIAEHRFGLRRGVDFGYTKYTECNCKICMSESAGDYFNDDDYDRCCAESWEVEALDYISNYQPVLEKLRECKNIHTSLRLIQGKKPQVELTYIGNHIPSIVENGGTIGEAICRAYIEYDKAKRGGE